jgi:hypothetical protein
MTIQETEIEKLCALPRRQVVHEWSGGFDSVSYPRDFYFQTLQAVQAASNESQLHACIVRLLKWKDGKIREDPRGTLEVGGVRYSAGNAKPNIYAPNTHDRKLRSGCFYEWSGSVMTFQRFSKEHLETIKERFQLWSKAQSLVIPAFLLHILNPRVFPIFDQHVERARRFFAGLTLNSGSADIALDDYVSYHEFWLEWLDDCGIDPFCAEYAEIKQVDDALWSIGKCLSGRQKSRTKTAQHPSTSSARGSFGSQSKDSTPKGGGTHTTSSPEFINRVFSYLPSMTQRQAMGRAALELGVELPPSYLRYPASHIDRWRKQSNPIGIKPVREMAISLR